METYYKGRADGNIFIRSTFFMTFPVLGAADAFTCRVFHVCLHLRPIADTSEPLVRPCLAQVSGKINLV